MHSKTKGIIAMMISTFGFALMGMFVKLAGEMPLSQKVAIRSYMIMIAVYVMMRQNKVTLKGIKHFKLLLLRSVLGTLGILFNYYALDHLLLSDASILFRLSTFILLFFSWFFLKEKIKPYQLIATIVAFIGLLFVIKPEFNIDLFPYFIGLLGATFAAGAYTAVRALSGKEKPLVIVFFFATFTAVVLTPVAIVSYETIRLSQLLYAILAGLFAAIGQVGVTYAYRFSPAREISIYTYLGVVFSAVISFIVFSSFPDGLSILGYIVIFASAFYMWRKSISIVEKKS